MNNICEIINLCFVGVQGVSDFMNTSIEIQLPPEPSIPYKYIHDIEYLLLNHLFYRVSINGYDLINSDSNNYSKISGITLKMYDEIENRKQIRYYSNENIIRFNPYQIYKGCLDHIINPDNPLEEKLRYLNNMAIYFSCEISKFSFDNILIRDTINYEYIKINEQSNYDMMISYNIINELNEQGITWRLINEEDDEEDENPEKRSKLYN